MYEAPAISPNIVTLRRVDASNNNSIHITSDFLENAGDLHNILQTRLRSGVYLNEGEVFRIFIQMALGVKYHRYLAPDEFQACFKCDLEEFEKMPVWKQKRMKQKKRLY